MELIRNPNTQMTNRPAPPAYPSPTVPTRLTRLTGEQLRAMPPSEMDAVIDALVTTAGESRVLRFRIIEMEDRIEELLEHLSEARARTELLESDRTGQTTQLNGLIEEMARDKLLVQHGEMARLLLDEAISEMETGNPPDSEFVAQVVRRRAELVEAMAPLLEPSTPRTAPDANRLSCVVLPFPCIKKEVDPHDPPI